jgi:dolichyl-phosphate-mannose-protein mannosyltransferase
MSKKWLIIILLSLGLLTRFAFFGHPSETVFDEVHFGKFISGYYTHQYFFDIHPPLGKLMIAGFAKLFDFKPGFAFTDIGNQYPDQQYMLLRFLPSLAGALLPSIIFLLALEMGLAPLYAFTAGMLIVLDNAILTQSIYILMDAFLLLFGFASLLFYFKYKNDKGNKHLFLFTVFVALAASIKWTGLGFFALPMIFEFFTLLRNKQYKNIFKLAILPIIAFLIYFAFFAIHLGILNKSGPGDAFMSTGFRKALIGNQVPENPPIIKANLFQKFSQLNIEMYKANQGLNAGHPYGSAWYTWPLMSRPIFYWVKNNSRIYLMGNPMIWWTTTLAIVFLLTSYIFYGLKNSHKFLSTFLIAGYTLNLLPFIGVKRVMFLYHYFTAYIFAIMILVWLISQRKSSKWVVGTLIVLSTMTFIYFAPLSYGLNLSPRAYELRVWLASWR